MTARSPWSSSGTRLAAPWSLPRARCNAHVAGVVALAPQTYGAHLAGQLAPRPLLVVHGKADTRLPYSCGVQIYHWAQEPKQLVLYEGAEHRLDECAARPGPAA